MVRVIYDDKFRRTISKIKDLLVKEKIGNQVAKIIKAPEVGKPMQYARKGTREVYVKPYRLSYKYDKEKDIVEFLEVYHKDKQ